MSGKRGATVLLGDNLQKMLTSKWSAFSVIELNRVLIGTSQPKLGLLRGARLIYLFREFTKSVLSL
jgi:hypothetical protein